MVSFPDIIKINFTNEANGEPVSDIAAKISLFANHKNDYNFILPLSDQHGSILITKKWLEDKITSERNFFIMDYASDLNDCKPIFKLSLLDANDLENTIDAMYLFQDSLKMTNAEIIKYQNAKNSIYKPIKKLYKVKRKEMNINIKLSLSE